jgi:cadmium resistance protein CadD (predicted permease)
MIETIILLAIGFIAFFATGIDDTVAYAGSYLNHKKKNSKRLISLGIIIGTIIALVIAVFAGSLMEDIPARHLVGGAVLITLGLIAMTRGRERACIKDKHFSNLHEKIKKNIIAKEATSLKFIGLGMILFFATGIDDILAYSNLIMAKGSWLAICVGVMIATFVSLIIAHKLSDKLKYFKHPEKLGGVIIIIIGLLIAFKVL